MLDSPFRDVVVIAASYMLGVLRPTNPSQWMDSFLVNSKYGTWRIAMFSIPPFVALVALLSSRSSVDVAPRYIGYFVLSLMIGGLIRLLLDSIVVLQDRIAAECNNPSTASTTRTPPGG